MILICEMCLRVSTFGENHSNSMTNPSDISKNWSRNHPGGMLLESCAQIAKPSSPYHIVCILFDEKVAARVVFGIPKNQNSYKNLLPLDSRGGPPQMLSREGSGKVLKVPWEIR